MTLILNGILPKRPIYFAIIAFIGAGLVPPPPDIILGALIL